MRSLLFTAIAAGAAIAIPAQARDDLTVLGQSQREFSETVQFGDLNLAEPAAAGTLRHRVVAAAGRVCADAHRSNDMGGRLIGACTTGTYTDAKPAIARALALAESGKQVAMTAITIRV